MNAGFVERKSVYLDRWEKYKSMLPGDLLKLFSS